jgi:hypothetical protein
MKRLNGGQILYNKKFMFCSVINNLDNKHPYFQDCNVLLKIKCFKYSKQNYFFNYIHVEDTNQFNSGYKQIIFAPYSKFKLTNLTKEIVRRGVKAERLILGESIPKPEYLARYRVADLFLDTQPYNAGTTASDALRMGLPMLTLLGDSYQSRMGASILSALNLSELITTTAEEYESLAIELASNPEKLKAIKDKLASNLSTAPLYNTPLFTKNLESAFTEMYERYHQGLEPDHIYVE